MNNKNRKIIIWVIFLVYLALLMKVILFKYPIDMIMTIIKSGEILPVSVRIAYSNFVPMRTIFNFLFRCQNIRISMKNILGNIIAFAPLGFLLPIVFNRINKLKSVILSSFILSLMLEIIQLLTAIGRFDVDDILLNVFGSICGYMLYQVFFNLISKTAVSDN